MVDTTQTVDIIPPPRRTGMAEADATAINQWVHDFYEAAIIQGGLLATSNLSTQLESQFPLLFNFGMLVGVADSAAYFTDEDSFALMTVTPFARTILDDANAAAVLATIGATAFSAEDIEDIVALMIQNGTGITWTYNDAANQLTGNVTITQYTDEMVDDRVAVLIQNGTGITWTYNDGLGTLTPAVTITQYTDEMVDDRVAVLLQSAGGITFTYNDGANTLTPALDQVTASGNYTPTLFNTTNLSASTAHVTTYMRVGATVMIGGYVEVDPTAVGLCELGMSVPVASNFAAEENAGGTAFDEAVAGLGAAIYADAANDRLTFAWTAVDTSNRKMRFTAIYRII